MLSEEMKLGMALQLFIAFLQFFPSHARLSAHAYNRFSSICPMEFDCGNIGYMRFPFANFTQPDCGLSMLDCSFQPLPSIILSPSSGQWFIARSGMQGNMIKLKDQILDRFLLAQNSSCDPFNHILFLPNSPSISFTIKFNITIFRCRKFPPVDPDIINYFHDNSYRKYESCNEIDIYYRNPKYYGYDKENELPPPICSPVTLPMIPWEYVSEDTELFQLLTADFDLEWHLSDRCYHGCHLKGGRCETNEMNEFRCVNATTGTPSLLQRKNKLKIILVTAASVGSIALLVILILRFRKTFLIFSKGETEKNQELEIFLKKYESITPKRYHYSDVKKMTNSFSIKLGQGGYGSVYKGKLQDGSLVAVKILNESNGNGEEFTNEVACISKTSHINIVTLLGFCFEGRKRALIYEFVANGSLEKFIYGEKSLVSRQLQWPTLYRIAVGIARGLEYLHCGCNRRILHFDIKPHNILLDEDFCPKITDFGLAKLCTRKESMVSTMAARGTIGYIAPEIVCKNIGVVSQKSDVYSYGMMVLEMVGGRKNLDVGVDHTSEIYFPHWIYTRLDQGEELGLSGIKDEVEDKQARRMLIVSLWCIQTDPSSRPTISNVIEMLEGPFEDLQMPPKFFFHAP